MKKIILPFIAMLLALGTFGQTYNITFQVDMSTVPNAFTTPEVNGTFNNWCGGCAPMTDANSDGIWEITIPLNVGTYEYKFAADSWNIQETLNPGSSCTLTTAGFTNRLITVSADATLDAVCWGSCTACSQTTGPYDVTFQVNMNDVTDAYTTPEVNGAFNNWCGGCAPMSDVDGDGIWELTISLNPGTYEFKYAADAWAIQETLTPGSSCTLTTGEFTNRLITVEDDVVLDPVCWSSCTNCGVATPSYDVTFQVNMNDVTDAYTIPEINGTFNAWCGGCAPMSDEDGDGIYEITITLDEGSYEYKFAADAWTIQEMLTEGDPCTVNAAPFVNRILSVDSDITLPAVCWGSCSVCGGGTGNTGIINLTFDDPESITVWTPVADATLPEATLAWNPTGLTTGALDISGSNTSSAIGRAYIFQYVDGNVDFGGQTSVQLSFDIKLAAPLSGSAIHMQTELAASGSINNFDIQNAGVNENTWTHLTYNFENIGEGSLFRIQYNLAAGAFLGAGGQVLIDNIMLVGLGDIVQGCTDPEANNYNVAATNDDGSCLYNVTFHVNMNEVLDPFTTPEINGTFNDFCGGCAQMTDDDGDNIWSITVELAEGSYEYKFAADAWAIQEELTQGSSCTVTNNGFTNRSLNVTGATELPVVCWASCLDCGEVIPTFNITFQVNMADVVDAYTTPEVNGQFNNWCGGCAPMTDENGDNVWELTIALEAGEYEFKYAADSWNIQEALTPGSTCTVTTDGFTNRILSVTEDMTLPVVCWGSCENCDVIVETYDVTFQVDMSQVTEAFTTPEVNGTFNDWCGGCAPMSDADGDNIWTLTITLEAGAYEFKYAADSWNIQEELASGSSCTVTLDGFTNRTLNVTEDMTMDAVCWASCSECVIINVAEAASNMNVSMYPNPANTQVRFDGLNFIGGVPTVRIFNTLGRLVQQTTIQNTSSPLVDVSALENGIYMIELGVDGVQFTQKLMIQH